MNITHYIRPHLLLQMIETQEKKISSSIFSTSGYPKNYQDKSELIIFKYKSYMREVCTEQFNLPHFTLVSSCQHNT